MNYVFIAFGGVIILQLVYLLYFYFSIKKISKFKTIITTDIEVSVVVYVNKNSSNIERIVNLISNQVYNKYELVLVIEDSTCDSLEISTKLAEKHKFIKVVDVKLNENFWKNKKYALTLGIKAASYGHILMLNSETNSLSENWISSMARGFGKGKTVVLGGYSLDCDRSNLSNVLNRYDNIYKSMCFVSYASKGKAYLGTSNNMGFTKKEFLNNNGFVSHIRDSRPLDYVFIQEISDKKNTSVNLDKNNMPVVNMDISFSKLIKKIKQRIKHNKSSKASFFLGFFQLNKIMFWIMSIVILILFRENNLFYYLIGLFFFRLLLNSLIVISISKIFNKKNI